MDSQSAAYLLQSVIVLIDHSLRVADAAKWTISRYLYLFYLWIFVEQVICNIFNGCMLFFCSALLISNFSAFRIYFFFVSLFTCFCFVLFPTKAFRIVETWSNIIVYGLWMNKKEMKRRSETGTKTTCIHSK